MYNKTQGNQEY